VALPAKLTFSPSSPFFTDLRAQVDAYFSERKLSRYADRRMVAKTVFWLVYTWGTWALLLANVLPFPWQLLLWANFGFGLACIGFNIGHDAIHQSYSHRPWVNGLLSWTFDMMGACSGTWAISHNIVHHTWTNVPGVDDDIEPGPTLRFYARSDIKWFHRYQHYYAWFLYSLVGILWMYHKDYMQILRKDPRTGKRAGLLPWLQLIAGKSLHLVLLFIIPLVVLPNPVHTVIGYLVGCLVGGFTLAIVFQMAHVVEEVVAPRVTPGTTAMNDGWADHQMRTTANFGGSFLARFITGGLDHQIEHHLFPRVCHIHYPDLAPIVKACAEKHGLPYLHSGTFWQAVGSHTRVMKAFGRGEAPLWQPRVIAGAAPAAELASAAE
jgi:linoleoyl-CoA desaturase